MSDKKISQLDLVTNNASGDVFPMVQGGVNLKTTLSKIATFLQGFLPASETAKGFVELATQAETDTGTNDTTAVTPLKLKTSSQWATKINKVDTANTATGEDELEINAESGVATFTDAINHNSSAVFTIKNNIISTGDCIAYGLEYVGNGYPSILHYEINDQVSIKFHVANLKVGGGTPDTNSDIIIWFSKVN
jgi:hypothetical protein